MKKGILHGDNFPSYLYDGNIDKDIMIGRAILVFLHHKKIRNGDSYKRYQCHLKRSIYSLY